MTSRTGRCSGKRTRRFVGRGPMAVALMVVALLVPGTTWAEKLVVVTATRAELMSGGEVVGEVPEYQILEVLQEKGPWMLVECMVDDKYMKGYIQRRNVQAHAYGQGQEVVVLQPIRLKCMELYEMTLWPGICWEVFQVKANNVLLADMGGDTLNWVPASKVLPSQLAFVHFDRRVRVESERKPQNKDALAVAHRDRGSLYWEMLANRTQSTEERAKRIQKAIDDLEQSKQLNPKDSQVHVMLGDISKSQGKLDDAVASYTEAVRLNPKESRAYTKRAQILSGKGEDKRALEDLLAAVAAAPEDLGAFKSLVDHFRRCEGRLDGEPNLRDKAESTIRDLEAKFFKGEGMPWFMRPSPFGR